MLAGPRLRQVAVVAADRDGTAGQLQRAFGWPDPFHDPGLRTFGLQNAVFAVGDTFVEVVTPVQPVTTAGRYLQRRGGDSGYMAIFQVPDLAQARRRVEAAGIRVVFTAKAAGIEGIHLHPKDVPGAIVSVDCAEPPECWPWAGPQWTGQGAANGAAGLAGLTIEVTDPAAAAAKWASVLGVAAASGGGTATIRLEQAGQDLRFVPVASGRGEGITEVRLAAEPDLQPVEIAGVRFVAAAGPAGGSEVSGRQRDG